MLISQSYVSNTSIEPLQIISSDSGFYVYKDGQYYENVIIPATEDINNYIESDIALPSKKINKEEAYDLFFGSVTLTKEQLEKTKILILQQIENLSDENSLYIKFLFPNWQIGQSYTINSKIRYNNNLYKVSQNHISSDALRPDIAPSFYQKIKINAMSALEWEEKQYEAGDRVKYGEHVYESLLNNNFWSPENFPNAWKLIQ